MTQSDHLSGEKKANRLINESSPYLLQHAWNPVDWHAWNPETLQKAKDENKMLLISIGYSACHWCHVMERESFENEEIAALMNKYFINIKVDREERPDVDSVYLIAVQLINGNGGWPLNCFALPDGRPFYGGTYYRPEHWLELLTRIVELRKTHSSDLEKQAVQISKGLHKDPLIPEVAPQTTFSTELLNEAMGKWQHSFDLKNGGYRGAPKFPMPDNFRFLLRYYSFSKDKTLLNYISLTLEKMMSGGIYDQLGGGFARYSVDATWKVPHFEKMLYDNAQLISLYCEAYQVTKNQDFLKVAAETADFVLAELTSPEGIFYSALDADSAGEEGKYYVWTEAEFKEILVQNSAIIGEFYGLNGPGYWEEDQNILVRSLPLHQFCSQKSLDIDDFENLLKHSRIRLLETRQKRVRPGLDDKSLTSWNSLMINALADLYIATKETKYLNHAIGATQFIIDHLVESDGSIYHTWKNGKRSIEGFLEDYSFFAGTLFRIYQLTMEEKYIYLADQIVKYSISEFYDKEDGLFWFTDRKSPELFVRKKELTDNVIPSSNSMMAGVLFNLGHIMENNDYQRIAERMVKMMGENIRNYPTSFSGWAAVWFKLSVNYSEVIVCGDNAHNQMLRLIKEPLPVKIIAGSKGESTLPIFRYRYFPGNTRIYVCRNKVCKNPVTDIEEAVSQIIEYQS